MPPASVGSLHVQSAHLRRGRRPHGPVQTYARRRERKDGMSAACRVWGGAKRALEREAVTREEIMEREREHSTQQGGRVTCSCWRHAWRVLALYVFD